MKRRPRQDVVFQPIASHGLQRGINRLIDVVKPTLGPTPRLVAIEPTLRQNAPEILDDAGVIARRIIALRGRSEDAGAMFVRHLLWRLHEQHGDGTATAAVLFQSIFDEGLRWIAAGGNAMHLRKYLEEGLQHILAHLDAQTRPIAGKTELARLAESVCYDPPLAAMLGEIFDIIGEYGHLDVRVGRSRAVEREYVEGMYWKSGVFSRAMLADQTKLQTHLEQAALLISDLEITKPRDLVPLLELAMREKIPALVIVARKISDGVTALLLSNQKPEGFSLLAVKTPGFGAEEQAANLQDLATLTGGRALFQAAGASITRVTLADLGRARRAWASTTDFGISGGRGDPRQVRMLIADLRAAFARISDPEAREQVRRRLSKLIGGSATLWVGADSPPDVEARKQLAERTARVLRGAILEGVVPGGGAALLGARALMRKKSEQSSDLEARAAYAMLARSCEMPMRTLIANAGHEPATVVAAVERAGAGYGFDVRSEAVVDMASAGIVDAASVQKAAVHAAVAGAALALTVDVLIHKSQPETSINP